jgi:hypothetical protein
MFSKEISMLAKRRIKRICGGLAYVMTALVLLTFTNTILEANGASQVQNSTVAAGDESIQHYKMISTVEYVGQGQFTNQVEELFTVKKKTLSNDKVQYFISANDLFKEISFVVDRDTQHLSNTTEISAFWAQVNNDCVKSLKKVTSANIGKTWKQTFDLSSVGVLFPAELKLTLTAIQVENKEFGKMIAVRALSEPFFVKLSEGTATSTINTVYLFDPSFESIFLSVSVFKTAATRMNGFQETLRHEVATCKVDATGESVGLKGFGKEFEKFVAKLDVTKGLTVVKATTLPEWAQTTGLQVAQAAHICSALSCEGALNPVATITMPVARVVELQKIPAKTGETVAANAAGGTGGPWKWLVDKVGFWPAVGIVGIGVGGVTAIAVGGGGGSSSSGSGSGSTPASP